MHVTFRQLEVFEAVARLKNFTRAAEELHLSQPAVSMQIRQLEKHVGLALFEQLGKKIFLTEAGKEIYHYSRVIAEQLEEAGEVIEALKGLERGHLSVAVASTANYFATRLLANFSDRIGDVTVSLDVTNREGLLQHLEGNEIELVVMGQPPQGLDLLAEPFMDNPLVVIAAPDHPFSGKKNIKMDALKSETFVVREPGSGTRIAMQRFFAERGFELMTGMELSSNEAIKQAVGVGMGLGIVSVHTLELELVTRRLVVLDVEGLPIMRQWYVVHRKGKRLSPVALRFKDFVLNEAEQLLATRE